MSGIIAQSTDGVEHEFPDGTDPAVIDKVMKDYAVSKGAQPESANDQPTGRPKASEAPSIVDRLQTNPVIGAPLQTVLRSGQGLEQLAAHGAASVSDLGGRAPNSLSAMLRAIAEHVDASISGQNKGYEDAKARVVAASDNPRVQEALINTGEVGGNMLNPTGLAGNAIKATPTVVNAALRGAVSGGAIGASQPVTSGDFATEKAKQVATGAVTGAATGSIASALGPKTPNAPTTAELQKAGSAKYKEVEGEPVPVTPEMLSAIKGKAGQAAIAKALEGADANREVALASELESLVGKSPPPTISANAADKISRAFRTMGTGELRSPTGDENIARGMFGRRADVETALEAVPKIKDARGLWARYERSQIIDDTIQAAKDIPSTPAGGMGLEPAIRKEFAKLLRNDKLMSGFSEAEKEAIKRVSEGTLSSNILRRLGKFSPVHNHLTALLELSGASGGGVALGAEGAIPAIGLATGGEIARQGATAATMRNANAVSEMVRRGYGASATPGPPPNAPVWNPASLAYGIMQPRR